MGPAPRPVPVSGARLRMLRLRLRLLGASRPPASRGRFLSQAARRRRFLPHSLQRCACLRAGLKAGWFLAAARPGFLAFLLHSSRVSGSPTGSGLFLRLSLAGSDFLAPVSGIWEVFSWRTAQILPDVVTDSWALVPFLCTPRPLQLVPLFPLLEWGCVIGV